MVTKEKTTWTTLTKEQKSSPYLTTIKKEKREFYPKFGDEILEFSIFDVSIQKTPKGDIHCIGVKILGSMDAVEVINVQDLNLADYQYQTIQVSFTLKGIGFKKTKI